MSILCVLACIYWSQQSSGASSSRSRQDSDWDEADNSSSSSKGQSPSTQSHQRTQSLSEKCMNSGNNSSVLIQRKVNDQSINGSTVH